jgi:cellulose synthase/poly-beta-1,6-N-acetylglucosamine synthase-like glycosyltransferase
VAGGTALHPRDRRHRRAGRDRRGLALFAALLACAYLWDICDALGSERWRRRLSRPEPGRVPDSDLPFISLHVPAHNEPPDMVLDTLRSLLRLDYPRFEVIVIDDNTDEEALWRPLEAWCARHGAKFRHLEDWPATSQAR